MGDNVNNDGDIKVYEMRMKMIELYTKYDLHIHTYIQL